MAISALTRRDQRRQQTQATIHHAALELTVEHGLDGWTMNDLAERADVSRRTLFNHFGGKTDAVFGGRHEVDADALAVFLAGGPSGSLLPDLVEMAAATAAQIHVNRETISLRHRVMCASPQLALAVTQHFEEKVDAMTAHVLEREGAELGADRARLAINLLRALLDTSLQRLATDPHAPDLPDLMRACLTGAQDLLDQPASR